MAKNIITFKSKGIFFHKEYMGWKRNTIRKMEMDDDRFNKLCEMIKFGPGSTDYIEIVNAEKPKISFKRKIKDVSYWDGLFIISW